MNEENEPREELSALEEMKRELLGAVESVRSEARDQAIGAVKDFARNLETKRSHTPPVPPKGEQSRERHRGDVVEVTEIAFLGDGRDAMYGRMRRGLSGDDLKIHKAARNPGLDALARNWAAAIHNGDQGGRIRAYHEINDAYIKSLGISRASLLEGSPTGEDPLSDGSGAELLPLPLANQLMVERDKASKFRGLVNVFPMTAQVSRIPVLPTATATSRAENAAFSDNTPAADSALLTAHDIGVMFSAGRNFLEDTGFNIANQLTVVAGGAIGAEEDVQIATSTANGADITEGLDAATITDVAETTTNAIGFVDIVAVYYSLPEQYRRGAVWFAAGTTLADLMTATAMTDTAGRPILLNGMDAPRAINDIDPAAVGTIMGHNVYEVPVADDVIYFGNPMWYALGQRTGIRVDTDKTVSTGNRQWVIDERIDGRVIPTSAVGTNNAWRKIIY